MAKGNIAKQNVINKIQKAFGDDFIGEYDKKLFVWAQENGEQIQIAISLTCPKIPVAISDKSSTGDYNFEDDAPNTIAAVGTSQSKEITSEERERVNDLIKKLGL